MFSKFLKLNLKYCTLQSGDEEKKKNLATIEAKPLIKNPLGDVTRFMPTSLRVKRSAKDSKGRTGKIGHCKYLSFLGIRMLLSIISVPLFMLTVWLFVEPCKRLHNVFDKSQMLLILTLTV